MLKESDIPNQRDSIHGRKTNAYGGGDPSEDFPKVNPVDVFTALKNVNEIWIVKEGNYGIENYYLDSSHGGVKITREETFKSYS